MLRKMYCFFRPETPGTEKVIKHTNMNQVDALKKFKKNSSCTILVPKILSFANHNYVTIST